MRREGCTPCQRQDTCILWGEKKRRQVGEDQQDSLCLFEEEQGEMQFPANSRRLPNVGLTLSQHLRRWPNIEQTLVQRFVCVGKASMINQTHRHVPT